MALTLRNVVNRPLAFYEFDGNLQFVETKALEAQAARDAAVMFANVFDSTALGIAGTTNGQYFTVPGTGGVYLELYKNVAGVATLAATLDTFVGGTLAGALNEAPPVTIASAANIDIGAAASNTVIISGSAAITSLGTIAAGAIRHLRSSGTPTFTHNATSLILPGGANITAAVGDVFRFESLGAGNWRLTGFQSGAVSTYQPLDATLTSIAAAGTEAFKTFVSADQTITTAGALTLPHGLGAAPRVWGFALVCQTEELGYSAGDVTNIVGGGITGVSPDSTNLNVRYHAGSPQVVHKSTGTQSSVTPSKWKARFFAIK